MKKKSVFNKLYLKFGLPLDGKTNLHRKMMLNSTMKRKSTMNDVYVLVGLHNVLTLAQRESPSINL